MKIILDKPSLSDFLINSALWQTNLPKLLQYCFLFGSNFQCIAILIWSRFLFLNDSNKDDISLILKKLCEILTLNNLLNGEQQDENMIKTLLISTYSYFWIFFLIIFLMFIRFFCGYKQISNISQLSITYLGQFYLSFGFWFTNITLFSTLVNSPLQRMLVSSNIPYLLVIVSSVILIMINYAIGVFFALFSYDPFINSNPLSCHSSIFQFLTFLFKAVAAPCFILFNEKQDKPWSFVVMSIFIMLLRHYNLVNQFPFYDYKTMKQTIMLSSICLITSFLNLVSLSFNDQSTLNFKATIYAEIVLTLIAIKFWHSYLERKVLVVLGDCAKGPESQESILKFFFSFNHLNKNANEPITDNQIVDVNEMLFWGVVKVYSRIMSSEANLSDCQFFEGDMSDTLNINKLRSSLYKFRLHILRKLLEGKAKKLKNNNKLKILFISLFAKNQEYIPICLVYLMSLFKGKKLDRIIASRLSYSVQEHLYSSFNSKKEIFLDVFSYINFETISEKLARLIHSSCQRQTEFWNGYEENIIQIQDSIKKCNKIEEEHDLIKSFWETEIEPNKLFKNFLITSYSLYLSLIRNQPGLAASVLKKRTPSKAQQDIIGKSVFLSQEILNDKNTLTFYTSMSKEKLGNLLDVSPHIVEVLGWRRQEIVGKNLNILLPLFMRESHNIMLEKHLQKMEDFTRLNRILETFIVDRSGYILPCQLYVSLHPNIQKELVYIAIVKVKTIKEDHIMLNNDGYLAAFTKNIGEKLNLILENEINIEEICQNYYQSQKILTNNQSLEARKGLSQRKLEKNARSFRIKTSSGKLLSNQDSSQISRKITSPLDGITLDFISTRATTKSSSEEIYQYSTQIKQETACNMNFYVLKLNPLPSSKIMVLGEMFGSSRQKIKKQDITLTTEEPQFEERVTQITNPFSARTLYPLISSDSESDKKLLELSQKQSNKFTKFNRNLNNNFGSKIGKKTRVSLSNASNFLKQDECDENFKDILNIFDTEFSSKSDISNESQLKFEKAIHTIPKNKKFILLRIVAILLIFISRLLVISYQFTNTKIVDHLDFNVEVLSQITKMFTQIIEINRGLRVMLLVDLKLIVPSRFENSALYKKITDIKKELVSPMLMYTINTNILNNNMKRSLYELDSSLQTKMLEIEIPVYESGQAEDIISLRRAHVFDFTTEIVSKAIGIINSRDFEKVLPKARYYFILNNTLNDFLVSREKIIPILKEDSQIKLYNQLLLISVMCGVTGLFSIYFALILCKIIKDFIKKRNSFINVFTRLENEQITNHGVQIKRFALLLERNNFSTKGLESKITKQLFQTPTYTRENFQFHKKSVNRSGINKTLIRICFNNFILVASVLVIYFVIIIITSLQMPVISRKMDLMTRSTNYLYQLKLLYSMQYEYIQENITTTLSQRPIKEEYEMVFSNLTVSHDFFLNTLLDPVDGFGTDVELVNVIKGNICGKIHTRNSTTDPDCQIISRGALKSGVIGLISLFLSLTRSVISSFDNSQRSYSDMFYALNNPDLVLEEAVSYRYAHSIYLIVDDIIKSHVKQSLSNFKFNVEILVIIYGITGLVIAPLTWLKIGKNLEIEIVQWSKMYRQIPLAMVVNNKIIKTYLKEKDKNMMIE